MDRQLLLGGFIVLAFLASGCSKLVTVQGTVTLDGKPVERGSITFIPEEFGKQPAVAPLMPGGRFNLGTRNDLGAMRGKYKVVISSTEKGKEILPPTYSSTRQTVLSYEVPPRGSKEAHFALNSAGKAVDLPSAEE